MCPKLCLSAFLPRWEASWRWNPNPNHPQSPKALSFEPCTQQGLNKGLSLNFKNSLYLIESKHSGLGPYWQYNSYTGQETGFSLLRKLATNLEERLMKNLLSLIPSVLFPPGNVTSLSLSYNTWETFIECHLQKCEDGTGIVPASMNLWWKIQGLDELLE